MKINKKQFVQSISHHLSKTNPTPIFQLPTPTNNQPTTHPSLTNRYDVILESVQNMLKKKMVHLQKIKQLGSLFFETINKDISILQHNNNIKQSHQQLKHKITTQSHQAEQLMMKVQDRCAQIDSKNMVLQFMKHEYGTYVKDIKKYMSNTQQIHSIHVQSHGMIGDQEQVQVQGQAHIMSVQEYDKHFTYLVQIVLRFKNIIMNEYKQMVQAEQYEQHTYMLNFLLKCQQLLNDLQPFLIKRQCTFDKLVGWVSKLHKQDKNYLRGKHKRIQGRWSQINMQLCKCIYIGQPIRREISNVKYRLGQVTQKTITNISKNRELHTYASQIKQQLFYIEQQLGMIGDRLGIGYVQIMGAFLNRKICKRYKQLQGMYVNVNRIHELLNKSQSYAKLWGRQKEIRAQVNQLIGQIQTNMDNNSINSNSIVNIFNIYYPKVQAQCMQVNQYKELLSSYLHKQSIQLLKYKVLPTKLQEINYIIEELLKYQSKLIIAYNTYTNNNNNNNMSIDNSFEQRQEQLSISAHITKNQLINECHIFIKDIINNMNGYSLRKEDKIVNRVEQYIKQIQNTSMLVQNIQQLQSLSKNFMWIVTALNTTFTTKYLQSSINQLNFEYQDCRQRIDTFKKHIAKLQKHVEQLSKLTNTKNRSTMFSPVHRLIRDKTQLYQIILDIFIQCLYVYEESKKSQLYHLDMKGFSIFDEQALNYVYMIYEFKKKLREQCEQLYEFSIPKSLKEFLHQLYHKFIHNYNIYITYSQEQLQLLSIRIENAINFLNRHQTIFQAFERQLKKNSNKEELIRISKQINIIEEENKLILKLQQSKFKIKKLAVFQDLHDRYQNYFTLAKQITRYLENPSPKSNKNIQKLKSTIMNRLIH